MKYQGVYATFWADDGTEEGVRHLVFPWHFGWKEAQMYTAFFIGPVYFLWGMR